MDEITSEHVRNIREKLSLTQEEFAQLLGVSFATVNRWERGHSKPSQLAVRRIKEILNRSYDANSSV